NGHANRGLPMTGGKVKPPTELGGLVIDRRSITMGWRLCKECISCIALTASYQYVIICCFVSGLGLRDRLMPFLADGHPAKGGGPNLVSQARLKVLRKFCEKF